MMAWSRLTACEASNHILRMRVETSYGEQLAAQAVFKSKERFVAKESVLCCIAQTKPVTDTVYLSISSIPESLRSLRQQVVDFFTPSPLSQEELEDVKLAVGEACTNAVKHGSPDGKLNQVRVKCVKGENALVVEVADAGHGFDPDSIPPVSPSNPREGGMGILIMRSLMDTVEFEFGRIGTTVRLTKRWRREGSGK